MSPLVRLGCGLEGLRGLPEGAAALVLSDLPSGETRAPFDRPLDLPTLWAATWHALRPGGVAVFMASRFTFAAQLVASEPAAFRYDLIWRKQRAGGFLNAGHRPLRAHEFVLVFCCGRGTYNPQMREGFKPMHTVNRRKSTGANYGGCDSVRALGGSTVRHPVSVIEGVRSVACNAATRSHPQQKPEELLRWLVRTYSNPGELVVDPCAGSGSTGRAALAEGRAFLGWDSDPRFVAEVPAQGARRAAT